MEQQENSQPLPRQINLEHWTYEQVMKFLSDLPTERAMKDISKGKMTDAIRKVVEGIALNKQDLVKSLRLIRFRERLQNHKLDAFLSANKAVTDWLKDNPGYDIELKKE